MVALVAAAVMGADQVTKTLASHYLSGNPVHLIGPIGFQLTYNSGVAFGIGQGLTPELVVVGVVLVAVLLGVIRTAPSATAVVALGLIVGGATSNLVDRVARPDHGAVIDFIYTRYWPTFNVADACIVVGAALLVVAMGRRRAP